MTYREHHMMPSSAACRGASRLGGYCSARLPLFALVTGHLAIAILLAGCTEKDTWSTIERYLPAKSSWDDGARASIQALSEELHCHPHADMYRVYWRVPSEASDVSRYATIYAPKFETFGYEDDPGSGPVVEWANVDEEAIHLVARRNGTFEDFGTPSWTGRTPMPPARVIELRDRGEQLQAPDSAEHAPQKVQSGKR